MLADFISTALMLIGLVYVSRLPEPTTFNEDICE